MKNESFQCRIIIFLSCSGVAFIISFLVYFLFKCVSRNSILVPVGAFPFLDTNEFRKRFISFSEKNTLEKLVDTQIKSTDSSLPLT